MADFSSTEVNVLFLSDEDLKTAFEALVQPISDMLERLEAQGGISPEQAAQERTRLAARSGALFADFEKQMTGIAWSQGRSRAVQVVLTEERSIGQVVG